MAAASGAVPLTWAPGFARTPPIASGIGAAAAEHREALVALAWELAEALPPPSDEALRARIRAIESTALRIVTIGSPASGKTRLVNALAGMPGLLPSAPAPMTAITGAVHFGQPERPPGVTFGLFAAADWEALMNGSGRLGAGPAPGAQEADRTRLARLVEEMRTRAFMRLGDQYHKLLGQEHRLPALTAEARARYLGIVVPGTPHAGIGLYSDLTRRAEISLPSGRFAGPVSVIDPPGIDPTFPVRTELTGIALEGADLGLLVLGADEALTAGDRRLLEAMLARLGGRLVVFLDRGPEDARRVDPQALRGAVEWLCRQTVPGGHVPVVLGSSVHAEAAAGTGGGASARISSGLDDLAAALDEALFWGPALGRNGATAAQLEAQARTAMAAMLRETGIIRARAAAGGLAMADAGLADIAEQLGQVHEGSAAAVEARISEIWSGLRQDTMRLLRDLSLRAATPASSADDMVPGPAVTPQTLTAALRDALARRLEAQRADLTARIGAHRAALAQVLSSAGLRLQPGEMEEIVPAFDAAAALAPFDGVQPENTGRGAPPEVQRRLMAPYLSVLEAVVEEATLALGRGARAALEAHLTTARRLLDELRHASGRTHLLDETEARIQGCTRVAERLAAYCRVSAAANHRDP